jgi:2-polyprenyl-3-methyl-5-hydroxy-6-metoxy-1,4-benzoquinol methylase
MKCTLCASASTVQVQSFSVETLAALWQSALKIQVLSEYRRDSEIGLWRCFDCGILFFTPSSLEGSGDLYAQLETAPSYYMGPKWEHVVALEDLKGCEKILEIGCGPGSFLALARQKDGLEIEGVEQNEKAIEEATRRGLNVRRGTIEQIAMESPGSYDAICGFQVLEHAARPGDFLRACAVSLRPKGRLLLGLPNADSFIRYQVNCLDMPPHHMSRWPIRAVEALPRIFPFRVGRIAIEPLAEYHVEYYVAAYVSHAARGPLRVLNRLRVKKWLEQLLQLGPRRWLRGQTVYASYERI